MSDDFPLLTQVSTPDQLRLLSRAQLPALADELRRFLIRSVGKTGGHLASSLGVVELTIALHYVFDTPADRLVWDVGHQSYPHKVLTGRREQMDSLRRLGGLSGFTRRDESLYDPFGAGHASTSISAALGMALAMRRQKEERRAIAVIGDGALTGGMAFEALNHAGDERVNLLVILNDNAMSISKNVGAISRYLGRILASSAYSHMREGSRKMLRRLPGAWNFARKAESHFKGMIVPGALFEELGFHYVGPVDGHDVEALVRALSTLRGLEGPRFLHVMTTKGKGHADAEQDPGGYHGVTRSNPGAAKAGAVSSGRSAAPPPVAPTYTEVFGAWLCDAAERDGRLIAITPAMTVGSGMASFARRFPDRCIDVGIAEQHAVTLAAGLACEGARPVVAIYSTFLQRAYDQLIHDVALQNLPVLFAVDRAGIVGPDGPTHHGAFDLSYLRCAPNLVVMTPADATECRRMLETGYRHDGPAVVRYPRDRGPGAPAPEALEPFAPLEIGRAEVRRRGERVALLAFGSMVAPALEVGAALNATVANMRFAAPLDAALIGELAQRHALLVTLEENVLAGGAGSGVNAVLARLSPRTPVLNLGLPARFVEHGERRELLALCGLDRQGILDAIECALRARRTGE